MLVPEHFGLLGADPVPRTSRSAKTAVMLISLGVMIVLLCGGSWGLPTSSLFVVAPRAPPATLYVNSKTGRTLVVERSPTALHAFHGPEVAEPREKAAKLAVMGLLSMAAVANPVAAQTQDSLMTDLMKSWNAEYGAQFGQWDMTNYKFARKATNPMPQALSAPTVRIPRKSIHAKTPIEQVLLEWNKDYGSQYGTWEVAKYQPAKGAFTDFQSLIRELNGQVNLPGTLQAAQNFADEVSRSPSAIAVIRLGMEAVGALTIVAGLVVAANRFVEAKKPAVGEFVFQMAGNGQMQLRSAQRTEWTPPAVVTPEVMVPAMPQVAYVAESPTKQPAGIWATPDPTLWPNTATAAMAGASGQKQEAVEAPAEEYFFAASDAGEMQLQYIRKVDWTPRYVHTK